MSSDLRTLSVLLAVTAAALIAGCATTSPPVSGVTAVVDPYSIDPPKPYPTPSLPSSIQGLTALASAGNSSAQCRLGIDYDEGRVVAQSYDRALEWLTRSAAQHDGCGLNNLGNLYFRGDGVPQDYNTARVYYGAAAQVRYAAAFFNLGQMFDRGDDVPVDERAATEWFKKAALAKYSAAYPELGDLYAFGNQFRGHNFTLAVQYYRMALAVTGPDDCDCEAEHRLRAAQNLAYIYLWVFRGDDCNRYRMALELLNRTSTTRWSQWEIGQVYAGGYGVKKR